MDNWKPESIAAVVTCVIAVCSVLIYVGRSLGTLKSIGDGVNVALAKTDRHDREISEMKVELTEVKTRQADCSNCP